jgi:hypothetical protein
VSTAVKYKSDFLAKQEFKLDLQQKRQAILLYHWMSLDYLKGLKALIDALIKGADVQLELAKRQGRDELITNERWGVPDTSANWSTHVFPALEDFRKSTIKLIAWRTSEAYCGTGASQCARMIQEFSSMWMTPEEEEQFKQQWEAVYRYASHIDDAAGVGGDRTQLTDHSMVLYWQETSELFPRLPKFRVRTDVEGVSGRKPPRTGVYVAQDDPYATLQFAWTGNSDGILGNAQTLNEAGCRSMKALGRDDMWISGQSMAAYAVHAFEEGDLTSYAWYQKGDEADPEKAPWILSENILTSEPRKWYFVERVEGEFEDENGGVNPDEVPTGTQPIRLRCEANQPCPKAGFWFTPARANSRSLFEQGQTMPEVGGDYGATDWQWDEQQQ